MWGPREELWTYRERGWRLLKQAVWSYHPRELLKAATLQITPSSVLPRSGSPAVGRSLIPGTDRLFTPVHTHKALFTSRKSAALWNWVRIWPSVSDLNEWIWNWQGHIVKCHISWGSSCFETPGSMEILWEEPVSASKIPLQVCSSFLPLLWSSWKNRGVKDK